MEGLLIKKEIDGIIFTIQAMGALKACVLDRKVVSMLAPTVSGVMESGMDTEIEMSKIIDRLADGLTRLSDEEFQDFLIQLMSEVSTEVQGEGLVYLCNKEAINKVFGKKILTIYKLLLEIMRFNGFSFFGLVEGGLGMNITNFLKTATEQQLDD